MSLKSKIDGSWINLISMSGKCGGSKISKQDGNVLSELIIGLNLGMKVYVCLLYLTGPKD